MNGYRFYAEMQEERRSKAGTKRWLPFTRAVLQEGAKRGLLCNCIAIPLDDNGRPLWQVGSLCMDALTPVMDVQNAQVASGSVDRGYLAKRCVRIDEATARKLHPALFVVLDR